MVGTLILSALPSETVEKDPSATMDALENIQRQKWYAYVPEQAKARVSVLLELMNDLSERRCPRAPEFLGSSAFYERVRSRIGFFVRHQSEGGNLVYGADALHQLGHFEGQVRSNSRVTFGDLTQLGTFEFLLSEGHYPRLEQLRDSVIEQVQRDSADARSSAAPIADEPEDKDDHEESGDDAEEGEEEEDPEADGMAGITSAGKAAAAYAAMQSMLSIAPDAPAAECDRVPVHDEVGSMHPPAESASEVGDQPGPILTTPAKGVGKKDLQQTPDKSGHASKGKRAAAKANATASGRAAKAKANKAVASPNAKKRAAQKGLLNMFRAKRFAPAAAVHGDSST